jgi:hypothetical protein
MRHELRKQYDEKVHRVMEQSHGGDNRHSRRGNKYYCHNYKWQDCNDSGHCDNYDIRKRKWENKTLSDRGNKVFKPCSVHGPKSKHPSDECYKNPKSNKRQVQDKNVNTRRITMMRATQVTITSCALALIHRSQVRTQHQPLGRAKKPTRMRIIIFILIKKMKAGSHVPHKSDHQQHRTKSQLSQKGKKGETSPTFLDDDLDYTDIVLMELNSMDADLNRPDDVTNPFDFDM